MQLPALQVGQLDIDGVLHATCDSHVVMGASAKAHKDIATEWHAPVGRGQQEPKGNQHKVVAANRSSVGMYLHVCPNRPQAVLASILPSLIDLPVG